MKRSDRLRGYLLGTVAPAVIGAASLVATGAVAAPCQGPGAPTTTQTKCLTAIQIPGEALRSFDISFTNPERSEYYLADRSNKGVDVIDTQHLTFIRTIGGFVGIVLTKTGTVDNNHSGPDGVAAHGRWLYAGDGDSTLKVIDLDTSPPIKQVISTGGTTRVDEMALTTDGKLLLAANNAEDPPFVTLFTANGDDVTSHTAKIIKTTVDPTIIPPGAGLSIEQPAWDPVTKRFYTSIPQIANNPPGCSFGTAPFCQGGLLVTNPLAPKAVEGAFDPATNTGVVKLKDCGPNGASVGPHDNIMLGCTPGNVPTNTTTQVINATSKNFVEVGNITGSDEVWFNAGDKRYYLGASKNPGQAVLGVVNAETNFLIEKIPQSTGSHSVAALGPPLNPRDDDVIKKANLIFVPQVAPAAVVGTGGDTTTVGAGICGSNSGCVAVYQHAGNEDNENDQGQDNNNQGHDR